MEGAMLASSRELLVLAMADSPTRYTGQRAEGPPGAQGSTGTKNRDGLQVPSDQAAALIYSFLLLFLLLSLLLSVVLFTERRRRGWCGGWWLGGGGLH